MWEDIANRCNREDTGNGSEINNTEFEKALKLTAFLKENKETINTLDKIDENPAWKKFKIKTRDQRRLLLFKEISKYAAIIVLVFITGYFSSVMLGNYSRNSNEFTRFEIPNTEKGKIDLPDGTQIILNSGTTLRYGNNFSRSREVYFSGEGLFKVKSDVKNPFLVHLDDITIKVTGTTFNIRSYSGADTETTLIEGQVSLISNSGEELVLLSPNEQALFRYKTKTIKIVPVNPVEYSSWNKGKTYLKDKPLSEIAIYLEKWYDAKLLFEQEEIKNIRFTGTILPQKPLEQILQILQISEPLSFNTREQNGQKIISVRYKNK